MNWENLVVNLECIDSLPTLPNVFTRVTEMLNNPNTSAKKLAQIIEADQAIAIKLLKIVNSPFFGFSRKIINIQDAIVLLGFNALRNTVLSISVFRALSRPSSVEGFDLNDFWRHSIGTGLISRFLARKLREDPEKAFISGVVHDIGKIILEQNFEAELKRVLSLMKEKKIPFHKAELEVYRGTHCDLGSYVADKWNLPLPLVEAIDLHHSPGEATEDPRLVSIVHVANAVTKGLSLGFCGWSADQELDAYAFARLDISPDQLEQWIEEIELELEQSKEIFEIIS